MSTKEEGKKVADPATFQAQSYGSGTTEQKLTKLLLDIFIPYTREKKTYSPMQWKRR